MGAGIAEVCALAGIHTKVVEADDTASQAAFERIEKSLAKALTKGRIDENQMNKALSNLEFSTDLEALANCDIAIEAILEDRNAKQELFMKLDEILKSDAVLASNTSSVPISTLAAATKRPNRVVGMHFFNPVPIQDLVELIPTPETSPDVFAIVESFAVNQLQKQVIHTIDRAGFLVNRLLVPYVLGAFSALETGLAAKEDIDKGMRLGCGHPMGPLELADFVGLDILLSVADVLYEEFGLVQYKAPSNLRRLVEAGNLGRKTGRGVYDYGGL